VTGSARRWRLRRGGIVNIWQFGDRTFDFSGGRVILQGANGSGKSRTLELLLPLCLDGDLRHLGAKGYDSVSIRRLMLDEYSGGANRIGYAWVELCRTTVGGREEFVTSGIGVKVSRSTTTGVTGSWRFVTPLRVRVDFELARPDRTPLDMRELKERIGDDAVMDDQETLQKRLAAALYGIEDVRRYEDLLHLLRTLRNPDVGVKAVEGQLEEYLSMALPPLDHEMVKRLAVQFQDLESIRENMRRLNKANQALARFLIQYRQYAIRVLRERADSVHRTHESLASHKQAVQSRAQEISRERETRDETADTLKELNARREELQDKVNELTTKPEYSDISARRRNVDSLRDVASSALDQAAAYRRAEEAAATAVQSAIQSVRRAVLATSDAAARAQEHFSRAGLDLALLPEPPAFPDVPVARTVDRVPVDVVPGAGLAEVVRLEFPELDLDAPAARIRSSAAQSAHARHAASERRAVAIGLQRDAERLEDEHSEVAALKTQAEDAAEEAERATAHRLAVADEAADEAGTWLSQVRGWLATVPDADELSGEPPVLPPASELVASAGGADTIRDHYQDWLLPVIRQAQTAVVTAEASLQTLRDDETELNEELTTRQAGIELLPPLTHHSTSDRSGRAGAPFYQLVDFRPAVDELQHAGLEASLQASGLLNAWVFPDGQVTEPDLQDLIAAPVPTPLDGMDTLLSVLTPVLAADSPVPSGTVTHLLSSVRIAEDPGVSTLDGLVLSQTGRWRAGSLVGTWSKETAQYVGPAARQASRIRRIAELTELLEDLRTRLELQRFQVEEARAQQAALERHAKDFPRTAPVAIAQSRLNAAVEAETAADRLAEDKTKAHASADGIWRAKHTAFARRANDASLPGTSTAIARRIIEIEAAVDAIDALTSVLNSHYLPTLNEMTSPLAVYTDISGERRRGEAEAFARLSDYTRAEQALALHIETLGFDSQEFDRKHGLLERALKATEDEIPKVEEKHERAKAKVIRLETRQENDSPATQGKEQELAAQESRFDSALATEGLWAAAVNDDQPAPDRESALRTASSWTADTTGTELLDAIQALYGSLPAGYDARAISANDVFAIVVSDGEGSHSAATAADRTSHRLAEHRDQLDARYQDIFENYLLHDLADRLRQQIDAADDLCNRMNGILDRARSSQGVQVQLTWTPSQRLDPATREALALVRTSFTTRTPDQDARLRSTLRELIEEERDKSDAHYADVLSRALDYRNWYDFTVRVMDTGPEGDPRNRTLRRLSSGETRLVSYLALFAAAAAFYDTLGTADSTPLRLVLLDEAFERVDDPTITSLLELLAELDIDWIITWPGGSVFSPKISRLHIYDILRPTGAPGMAFVHSTWDGAEVQRD
jgi:uncharacterized protein (TIGR02680 family)